jgi:hypothetical protein
MITNRKKAEIIVDLHGAQKDPMVKSVLELIEIMIIEARLENDTANVDSFRLNQGEIRGLSRLSECIMRGLPGMQK